MDANIGIREIERIVETGPAYVGPHGDALAHVYGTASALRDIASTEDQRERIARVVAEFKNWFRQTGGNTRAGTGGENEPVFAEIAKLRRAFADS